jgi:DNA-binding transcriptional MerR regulator
VTVIDTVVTWRTADVARLSSTTYRQLDYWCSEGLVPGQPADPGSGSRRRWTYTQLRHVRCLGALTAAGVAGPMLREAATLLADTDLDWAVPLELVSVPYVTVTLDLPFLA